MLQCSDQSIYVGLTNNIERRLNEHKSGINTSSYTSNRLPVQLIWFEVFKYIDKAIKFEKKIKKWSRGKKLALANAKFDQLPKLSECKNETSHSNYLKE